MMIPMANEENANLSASLIFDKMSDLEKDDVQRELLKNNLKYLCLDIFEMSGLLEDGHDRLFNFLENSNCNKKLLLTPRETYKTSIITAGIAIQEILKNPSITILFSSFVEANAVSFLRIVRGYLENNKTLKRLFGNFVSDKWNESEIIVNQRKTIDKTPTISVSGADKSTTSQHYDMIFVDDIVNRQTVSTMDQIEKTERYFSDVFDLLKKPDGRLFVVGTRWDGGDLYGKIMDKYKQDFDILNLMATEDGTISGRSLYPKKYNQETLSQLLRLKGSYDFYLQIMNTVTSSDTQIFKAPYRYYDSLPKSDIAHIVLCDPAISKKEDSCDAAVVDVGLSRSGQIFVCDYTIFKGESKHPKNLIEKMIDYSQIYASQIVGIESVGYQEVLCILIDEEIKKRNLNVEVFPIRNNDDKARRIICLQPYWEQMNFLIKRGMSELEDQLSGFRKPITSKVDLLDAISFVIKIPKEKLNFTGSKMKVFCHPAYREFTGMNKSKDRYKGIAVPFGNAKTT